MTSSVETPRGRSSSMRTSSPVLSVMLLILTLPLPIAASMDSISESTVVPQASSLITTRRSPSASMRARTVTLPSPSS